MALLVFYKAQKHVTVRKFVLILPDLSRMATQNKLSPSSLQQPRIIDKMVLYSLPTSSSELNSFSNIFHYFLLGSIFFRLPTHCFCTLQVSSFSLQPQSCCHDLHSPQAHICASLTRHKSGSICLLFNFVYKKLESLWCHWWLWKWVVL